MEFLRERVFTSLNADELSPGDKVIVADTLDLIATLVNTGKGEYWVIEEIKPENFKQRFKARLLYHSCVNKDYCYSFAFAYLVERAEPHFRPFKNIDELVKVWVEKTKPYLADTRIPPLIMPLIWVKEKDGIGVHLINGFTDDVAFVGKDYEDMDELFEAFTFLDGSPCGVEE